MDEIPASSRNKGLKGLKGRLQLRAANILEDTGDLSEAARLYEHAGQHERAASLRLEHAQTSRSGKQRLKRLREAAQRSHGDGESVRELHGKLAAALLDFTREMPDGPQRRALMLETANALDVSEQSEQAGDVYDALGLLAKAAKAYEHAGAIEKLETVFETLECKQKQAQLRRDILRHAELAYASGQRRVAYELMREANERDPHLSSSALRFSQQFEQIRSKLPTGPRLTLEISLQRTSPPSPVIRSTLRVLIGDKLTFGRSPTSDIVVNEPGLSRTHATLEFVIDDAGQTQVQIHDQGSRAGTFMDGSPLEPGIPDPVLEPCELGLGIASSFQLEPVQDSEHEFDFPSVLLSQNGVPIQHLFAQRGGPLRLTTEAALPVAVRYDDPFFVLTTLPGARVRLNGEELYHGEPIDILFGDRIVVESQDHGRLEVVVTP